MCKSCSRRGKSMRNKTKGFSQLARLDVVDDLHEHVDQSQYTDDFPLAGHKQRQVTSHDELMNGATLELEMGPKPNKAWGAAPEDAPPSQLEL